MSWSVAFRLGRREVRRRPGRSALVALLVAVPVCGMTVAAVLIRTDTISAEDEFSRDYGDVDAVLDHAPTPPGDVGLPEGSEIRRVRNTWDGRFVGPDAAARDVHTSDHPLEGPFSGGYRILEGHAPAAAGEVALTPAALSWTGTGIGDRINLVPDNRSGETPSADQSLSVVGLIEDPQCLSCRRAVVHPEQSLPGLGQDATHLILLSDDIQADEFVSLSAAGLSFRPSVIPEAWSDDPMLGDEDDAAAGVRWSLVIGAVALTAAGIVISAAFAVGARRQLTTMGLLSASGASPKLLRRSLALQGTVSGVLGVASGWVLTLLILGVGRGQIESSLDRRLPAWNLRALDLAAIAVIGVVAATVAALMPARTAVRIPTLAALAGRRPLPPVPRWLTISGVVTIAVGLGLLALAIVGSRGDQDSDVWLLVAVLGGVLELLGACAVTPALAGALEPLAGRMRGSGRLAARSLARHRTRTGAVVAAVAAVAGLAVFAGGLLRALSEKDHDGDLPADVAIAYGSDDADELDEVYRTSPLPTAARDEVLQALPGSETLGVRQAVPEPTGAAVESWTEGDSWELEDPMIADEAVLDALGAPASLRRLLEAEGLVIDSWGTEAGSPGDEQLLVMTPDGTEVVAATSDLTLLPYILSNFLITPELAEELGLVGEDAATIIHAPKRLSESDVDALEAVLDSHEPAGREYSLTYNLRPSADAELQMESLLAGVAFLVALFVIATSLALAAAESRDEREVLTVVGTRPRDLARSAGVKAAILAGLGAALAVPLGLAPLAVTSWSAGGTPFRPPWASLALLLIVAPLVAALAATVASAIAQRAHPARVSTATFE